MRTVVPPLRRGYPLLQGKNDAADNFDALLQLDVVDDERRGQADDVAVRRFRQKSRVAQLETDSPGVELGVDDDGVEQALPADERDALRRQFTQFGAQDGAQSIRVGGEILLLEHVEGGHGHFAAERIAAVRGSVLARLDRQHDFVVG